MNGVALREELQKTKKVLGNQVTVRPPARPSAPQADQCKRPQSTGMATQMQLEVILAGNRITSGVL